MKQHWLLSQAMSIFFLSENRGQSEFLAKQHISFDVDSLEHVITTLNALGISKYETGEVNFFFNQNYKWCKWRDPSGIRLECIERV